MGAAMRRTVIPEAIIIAWRLPLPRCRRALPRELVYVVCPPRHRGSIQPKGIYMGQRVVAIALTVLLVVAMACIDRPDYTGSCRDARTREELKQVRDANGVLFPVKRVISEIGSLSIDG